MSTFSRSPSSKSGFRGGERALVLAAQAGDPHARHELVQRFLPLIGGVARTYRGLPSVERRELIQEGVLGLMRALERYDPALGTPFWSYASWWVRQAMQRLVSELSGSFVLSDRAFRQLARVRNAERRHLQSHGRSPTVREIAQETELSVDQVQSLTEAQRRARRLEEPAPGSEPTSATLGDSVADPGSEDGYDRVCQKCAAALVPELLARLGERERAILRGRYGLDGRPRSLRELGEELGVSAERVRQIETASLDKLRGVAVS
jgi:RNA polymerase sigma factor (sigma-70 family)